MKKQCIRKRSVYFELIKPICIHKELIGYERTRINEDNKKFTELLIQHSLAGDIIHVNSFFRYPDDYYTDSPEEVFFFDYIDLSRLKYNYYLYYELPGHSYHQPISESDISKHPELNVIEISSLNTNGNEINDLVSVQFVDKIISLIKANDYKYIEEDLPITRIIPMHSQKLISIYEFSYFWNWIFESVRKNIENYAKNINVENISIVLSEEDKQRARQKIENAKHSKKNIEKRIF